MKKILCLILALVLSASLFVGCGSEPDEPVTEAPITEAPVTEAPTEATEPTASELKELPKPQISGGARGELGIDININEATIDEYLGREDSVYRDMRMLEDPGNYESIGGDRFLSGYVEGFEVIPLPYIIPVTGLPGEVGDTYTGTTLFREENGTYIANYEVSMKIIERIFPKDKVIFLMCGGGGYAGMTKNFLIALGWDKDKIYNVGGYWYYNGKHNVQVKQEINGVVSYDFEKVPYFDIEFDKLTKSADYQDRFHAVTSLELSTSTLKLEEGFSYQLYAFVLPNEATNKDVTWTSNDESVATVDADGRVAARKEGTATITATSVEGNISASCEVTVNKAAVVMRVQLDDLAEEAAEFASYDPKVINETVENFDNYMEKIEQSATIRAEILTKLVAEKKTFIVIHAEKNCEWSGYLVSEGAKRVLDQAGYPYFVVGSEAVNGDLTLDKTSLRDELFVFHGVLLIVKDGEFFADSSIYSINSDTEMELWLNKYIESVKTEDPKPEENSAYAPYKSDSNSDSLCVLVNEPFDGTEPTATLTWMTDEYDRAYIVPRYNGSTVELYHVTYNTVTGEETLDSKPTYKLEGTEDGCVIYSSIFRPEGISVWYLSITSPDGQTSGMYVQYNGNTGTPRLEYIG